MMDLLRRGAKTWIAKLFFVLLVGSFGVWGVSSTILSPTATAVIKVGDQSIGVREFRLAYERQISQLSQQFGSRITTEQARAFGLDRQVYSQLAAGAALDQLSEEMRLGLSQGRLATLIAEEPAFRAPGGRFDRDMFSRILRSAGLTEEDYINSQSKAAVRSQLVDSVADGFKAPSTLVDAMSEYRNQTRDVSYFLLSSSNIEPVADPSNDELAKWYEEHKANYRAPEYREFTYLKLEPSDIMDLSAVSEDDVKADYERTKDRYTKAATRTIEQLSFPDQAAADAAAAKLASGEATFDTLVAESGRTAQDVMLGNYTKDKVPDQSVANAAFDIAEDGGTSGVVQGVFGYVILRATQIQAETVKSYDEVKDEIRKSLALSLAADEILNVHDAYEDARAGGATLEEAAAQLDLKPVKIGPVDARGNDVNGNSIGDLPEKNKLLSGVFDTDIGVEALPVNLGADGYVWFEVNETTPDRDRDLSEVQEKVLADWRAEKVTEAIEAKANAAVDDIKNGKSLELVAADMGLTMEVKSGLKRSTADDVIFSNTAVDAAFGGPSGFVTHAPSSDGSAQIVMQVTSSDVDSSINAMEDDRAQIERLADAAGDDILDQMVGKLQDEYGVTINQTLAQQAMIR